MSHSGNGSAAGQPTSGDSPVWSTIAAAWRRASSRLRAAQLQQMAHRWRQAGCHDSYLASGGKLAELEAWAASLELDPETAEFLEASRQADGGKSAPRLNRFFAELFNFYIILVLTLVAWSAILSYRSLIERLGINLLWYIIPSFLFVYFVYFLIFEFVGRTPGMWMTGLRGAASRRSRHLGEIAASALFSWLPWLSKRFGKAVVVDSADIGRRPSVARVIASIAAYQIVLSLAMSFVSLVQVGQPLYRFPPQEGTALDGLLSSLLVQMYDRVGLETESVETHTAYNAGSIFGSYLGASLPLNAAIFWFAMANRWLALRVATGLNVFFSFSRGLVGVFDVLLFILAFHPAIRRHASNVPRHMRIFFDYIERGKGAK